MTVRKPALAMLAAALLCLAGWGLTLVWAQEPEAPPEARYVYVGLNNNVARIDEQTGRIWVLKVAAGVDRRAGVNDIVTYPQHPWRWTEVRVMGTRGEAEEPASGPDEQGGAP